MRLPEVAARWVRSLQPLPFFALEVAWGRGFVAHDLGVPARTLVRLPEVATRSLHLIPKTTVQGAKTIHFSFFHTLTYFSVMLQAILTSKVPKLSPTSADQHGQGVNVSCDCHVMQLHSIQRPFRKKVRLLISTRL